MIKIALDAMGGDNAPQEIVNGAIEALNSFNQIQIILVGKTELISPHIPANSDSNRLIIHHADEVIEMCESPSQSFKKKKGSSIHIGLKMVKEKEADAFVSAGNTGAVMTASTLILGRIPDIDRPAIATFLPTTSGKMLMLDMGSTVDCKPEHLEQFAIMGHFLAKSSLHIDQPRIGLLNIGEEPDKGNQQTQAVYSLLKANSLNFIGNVESKDIFFDSVDVLVCDGFVGNAVLKFGEGLVDFFLKEIKKGCKQSFLSKIGAVLMLPTFKALKKKTDYEEIGGAPLLGVNGVSIIAHGKSKSKAIRNAIKGAIDTVESDMVTKIYDEIHKSEHL